MSHLPKFNTTMIELIVGLLLLATTFPSFVKCDPNTNLVNIICNGDSYPDGDPFGDSVAYVLMDLMNVTPSRQGFDYNTVSPYPTAVAYGHATCNTVMNNNDCANCLVEAKTTVSGDCGGRIGGQVQLVDCSMRFENYPF